MMNERDSMRNDSVSIVLPAKNEAETIGPLLRSLRQILPSAEIIVVDDGSADSTKEVASQYKARLICNPYSMGNGAAIKRGARAASAEILVFMDADGQHNPADIPELLKKLDEGYDMVVGARTHGGQASIGRGLANAFYNRLASWLTGFRVLDLTSGFRVVRAEKFREFLPLLPNGFSYPTTITMAFLRSAYAVAYVPVAVRSRKGTTSHIRPLRDGVRFLLIIFKIATLYSPLKLFAPISLGFGLLGLCHYGYTFITIHRFTNMSALLLSAAVIIFLIGLISEQITSLVYAKSQNERT